MRMAFYRVVKRDVELFVTDEIGETFAINANEFHATYERID